MKIKIICYILFILVCSCTSMSNPYKGLSIINYGDNTAYEFLNTKSDTLVIYIDGTQWYSVLGWKEGNNWESLSFSKFFLDIFKENANVMIPERLNMQIGKVYLFNPETRRNYTLENLVKSYSFVINTYLNKKDFSSVIIIGHSEGAGLLPLIYREIEKKDRITGMIAVSYGGLSVYEQVKLLADSEINMPDYYREACKNIDALKAEVELYPNSLGEIMGYTYGWWNSFLHYRPYDYYAGINIPILFIHGDQDVTVPVESTKYIQENMPEKPFDYVYINNADHSFWSKKSEKELRKRIINWVNKKI